MDDKTKALDIAMSLIDCELPTLEKCRKSAIHMAEWKDEQFWSKENIEKIIITYNSFPDRSCPSELVKKTIEKLKTQE